MEKNHFYDHILYRTYLGGSGVDDANRICVDKNGNVYFTGYTTSADFPVINAFDGVYNGKMDAFITKISIEKNRIEYSSYLGGHGDDDGHHFVVGKDDCIYVIG